MSRKNPTCPRCRKAPKHINGNGKQVGYCQTCWKAHVKKHRKTFAKRRPERMREYQWKRMGIRCTEPVYQAMLQQQGWRCKICYDLLPAKRANNVAVDHDHETGEVRGLLCARCNRGLGCFRDEPEYLNSAADYLTKHKDKNWEGINADAGTTEIAPDR